MGSQRRRRRCPTASPSRSSKWRRRPGNVAVTAVHRDGQAIVAALHNFRQRPARVPVALRVDGRELGDATVEVAPQSAAEVRLVGAAAAARRRSRSRSTTPQGYQADNARYLVLDPPGAVPVTVVTSEPPGSSNAGLYIERALAVAGRRPGVRRRVLDGHAFSALTPESSGSRRADRPRHEHARSRRARRASPRICAMAAARSSRSDRISTSSTLADTRRRATWRRSEGARNHGQRDRHARRRRRPPSHLPSIPEPDRRARRRPRGAVPASEVIRRDEPCWRVSPGGTAALTEQPVERGRLLVFASDLGQPVESLSPESGVRAVWRSRRRAT